MPARQAVLSIIVAFAILASILELVRRRKLKEEYSLLWILTGIALLILTLRHDLLEGLTRFLGIVTPINTLFFLGLIFTLLLCVHFAMKISQLTTHIKILAQKIAIIEADRKQPGMPEENPSAQE